MRLNPLECGSLLPLSHRIACIAGIASVLHASPRQSASRLAHSKDFDMRPERQAGNCRWTVEGRCCHNDLENTSWVWKDSTFINRE
jgi:hypothetical protein